MSSRLTVSYAILLVACGSSSGPAWVTTQVNPNLPSEETATYPVPEVPPPPVLPSRADVDAGDGAKD